MNCSFCKLSRGEVEYMIQGPGPVYICDQCIDYAAELLADAKMEKEKKKRKIGKPCPRQPLLTRYPDADHFKRHIKWSWL